MGSIDSVIRWGKQRYISELNAKFAAYAQENDNFYIHDLCRLSAKIELNTWHSSSQYYAYKLKEHFSKNVGKYEVSQLDGKNQYILSDLEIKSRRKIICSLPEYINGLEFKCVILVGVDEGRVPQNAVHDISQSFIKYSAFNKLYISCSRAAYEILILGSNSRGISSCLKHSLENNTLKKAE